MTLRKKLLGGLAALIIIGALIVAGITVTTKPTFTVSTFVNDDYVTFPVECHAIGPGQLNKVGRSDGSVDLERRSQVYEGMSAEDYETFRGEHGKNRPIPLTQDEWRAFETMVQDQISYHCGQLRENRQTSLIMTFGVSLLLLLLVRIAVAMTESRRDPIEKAKEEHGHNVQS